VWPERRSLWKTCTESDLSAQLLSTHPARQQVALALEDRVCGGRDKMRVHSLQIAQRIQID
jgi:hypothetical protein